jgi:beta-lactamase class A
MIDLLAQNKIGSLIEAGVPDGTRVAHKHGWPSSPFDMIGDAGIVYTPGGDYVFSLFLFQEQEMFWDPTSKMFADISRAVYNYFNPPVE